MINPLINPDKSPAADPHAGKALSRGLVLVVDDEPELVEMLEYSLRQQGYATLATGDGFSACRLIEKERPELILLDILMPDLDGWEVCRLLRSVPDEEIATIPVVMLTALNDAEDRLRGLELGADAYVAKPYSLRELLALAENLIARRRRDQTQRSELARLRSREQVSADVQGLLFHELRNQLVVIGGFSNMLARGDMESQPLKTRDYLKAIHRSSDYLSQLAEEFQMVRQIEDGSLELALAEVDVRLLVEDVMALFRPLAEMRQIALDLQIEADVPPVASHWAALKVVLSNLVDNAVKFSSSGSRVGARLFWDAQGAEVGVEISDTGAGIAEEEQDLVFQKFCRGRIGRQQSRGSGLGLYMVRTLLQALGGRVTLRSSPGHGCRFTVFLPVEEGQGNRSDFHGSGSS
ncbi:ATP-binding response regulator [Geoalkalibacter halelectricus]|uniref:histidine kinase n=1 Tax=Geoalkalibacter halelectricus TaxID=2847045 RepID=A0ABY5ZME2_9BACT|nr:hybrid sensor histidine kinase/response regulator [Geoalkalibacter halelectricus]MDO3376631.1 hybrid sensor histidine kinase/response regulator [Geoalkalibacter halelectricus]UWZ78411.1 hybrid sensor histidine kinase/response regulator [Geoalkalibacter halelectricus]